jgi:cysteine desulfurase
VKEAPIYLDHAATTPVHPEVADAMMPHIVAEYGNPSAVYDPGRRARHVVEKCRARVAELMGVGPAEIIFTSGGSESNNTALHQARNVLISNSIEHESVREAVRRKAAILSVVYVEPDPDGRIAPDRLLRELENGQVPTDGSAMASIMAVNNELGTINPIPELASILSERGIRVHTDAVQAAGVLDLGELTAHVDYMTLSGHKIGAPKGIGMLYVRAGAPYESFIVGGGQEQGRRAGTENVAGIVGFAKALELAVGGRDSAVNHMLNMRSRLANGLMDSLGDAIRFNSPMEAHFAPHILNFLCVDEDGNGLDGEMLILGLDMAGLYVSAGSACSSGTMKASAVLTELGMSADLARGAIRTSLNSATTPEEIDRSVIILRDTIARMSKARRG